MTAWYWGHQTDREETRRSLRVVIVRKTAKHEIAVAWIGSNGAELVAKRVRVLHHLALGAA